MFSKEWNVAISAISIALLAGCPHPKKNRPSEVVFHGLWINANADRVLNDFNPEDPDREHHLCQGVNARPRHFGVAITCDDEMRLDAWSIGSSGDVFNYTATAPANGLYYRDRYFAGRTNPSGQFAARESARYSAYADCNNRPVGYVPPFDRGNATLILEGKQLTVWSPGDRYTTYVPTTPDRLNRLSAILSACSQRRPHQKQEWVGEPVPVVPVVPVQPMPEPPPPPPPPPGPK